MLNTITQVQVDKRLVRNTRSLRLLFEIVYNRAVDIDSDLLFELFSVSLNNTQNIRIPESRVKAVFGEF